jgi:hypothetical protein
MNASELTSFAVIPFMVGGAQSALPDAPIIAAAERKPRANNRLLIRFKGRVATLLHRAAWRLEPPPSDRG